jgi:hypothetical protein
MGAFSLERNCTEPQVETLGSLHALRSFEAIPIECFLFASFALSALKNSIWSSFKPI